MLSFLLEPLSWFVVVVLLIIMIVLYIRLSQQLAGLRRDMAQLQTDLQQHKNSVKSPAPSHAAADCSPKSLPDAANLLPLKLPAARSEPILTLKSTPKSAPKSAPASIPDSFVPEYSTETTFQIKDETPTAPIEPDERSLPVVTSVFHSIQNWFLGGNLVVRVGVLVLLVGVVLLLRLLSEYIEISISIKLVAIAIIGLGLAGLGLKLAKERFAYGITLQGAGLAITYLATFFAYAVYHVIPSLPSFIMLGVLSAATVGLAVRQNAFPLALLALSGGFFAPILTSADTNSLVTLFSYYLLLNITIATIAHYRPWKALNLLGVVVTFGLAYYWGATEESLSAIIDRQRWSLVVLVALHLLLYLFVVIRYAQQIIAYNASHNIAADSINQRASANRSYLFPIDIGLLFSVPLLAFGLFAALLNDITNALTLTSAVLAAIYLGLGWVFIQRSQRYALITEGMLALGGGFLALIIPLALEAEWIAFGWSVQGLALVWFGRRSLRAWSVLFGLLLQLVSVGMLLIIFARSINDYPTLALTISAISYIAAVFILRASNSPIALNQASQHSGNQVSNALIATDTVAKYTETLGIRAQATNQWLATIDNQSAAFNMVWRSPAFMRFLTLGAIVWALYILVIDFDHWFGLWQLATTTLIAMATLSSLAIYWMINRYGSWREIRQFSHGLLLLFYLMLVLQLPQKFEFNELWTTAHWSLFAILLFGWLVSGQLWLKTWHNNLNLSHYDSASWLGTGSLVLAAALHYGLPDSQGVMALLIPISLLLAGLWLTVVRPYKGISQPKITTKTHPLYWFNWQRALLGCAKFFVPVVLCWVVITNWSYDGMIWNLPYFPLINLYDATLWLVLLYGLSLYDINPQYLINPQFLTQKQAAQTPTPKTNSLFASDALLVILGLTGFWIVSSMLVRTLHAFIGTPLWDGAHGGAWRSEQVQTGLTILWTLLALLATIMASRYKQRALWFMGIGVLAVVVLKLVLVDLSQTEAIWRVVSFLGAGSLILLIGYLAPLPPTHLHQSKAAET